VEVHLLAADPSAKCPVRDSATATAIGGTFARPLLLFEPGTQTASVTEKCKKPWQWQPGAAEVAVVPIGAQR
jgi:hypothetical protein